MLYSKELNLSLDNKNSLEILETSLIKKGLNGAFPQLKYHFSTQKDVEMSLPFEMRRFHPVIFQLIH